ncbi:cell wall-binding repeat-containing protein [Bacillus sp. 2205SS5-2]|uniref:cell wall-binding repeat-containing protein n=1 Tax=Bacillus sp. 2205SS5-2 TaxID=3109031 RepID=UPI0030060237
MKRLSIFLVAFLLIVNCGYWSTRASASEMDSQSFKAEIEKTSEHFTSTKLEDEKLSRLKESLHGNNMMVETMTVGEVYEQEPNDSFNLADYMELDDVVIGSFGWSNDVDIFRLDTTEMKDIFLYGVTETAFNDLGFLLFSPTEEPIYPDDGFVDGSEKLLAYYALPPGTYYLVALDLNENGGNGLYGLTAFAGETEYYENTFRIAGENRHETAIEISNVGWPDGAHTVVLARDNTFPDALAGAPLAYQEDAPILLNPKDELHNAVREQIQYLEAENVIILGGTSAISLKVEQELRNSGLNVMRIGGKSRYETAALIADQLDTYDEAIIAYGGNFPDALSIAPYAAHNGIPILLTEKDHLPNETATALKSVHQTVLVGGSAAISENVEKQLFQKNPTRIAGKDRFETSVNIASELKIPIDMVSIATGENFADALTGSVLAAKYYQPIILVKKNEIPAPVRNYLMEKDSLFYTILGGDAAVSPNVVEELASYVGNESAVNPTSR